MTAGVHALLRTHRDEILRVWEGLVAAQAQQAAPAGLGLRDHLAGLLDELAGWLAGGGPPEDAKVGREALAHVLRRLDEGLDLAQVLREYRLLRQAILAVVRDAEGAEQRRAGAAAAPGLAARVEELARLDAVLDVALSDAVARFVAERDRRAAALALFERRYLDLFESAPDAIFVNRGGRVALVNAACLALFGARTAADLLGKSPLELFHPDFHEVVRRRIALVDEGGRAPLIEERIVRLDGTTRDVEVTAAPFGGAVDGGAQVVLRDVTERNRVRDQVRATEARQAFVLRLSDALRPLSDPAEIQHTAARVLGERLGASRVMYADIFDESDAVIARDWVNGVPSIAGRLPVEAFGEEAIAAFRRQEDVIIDDVDRDPRLSAPARRAFQAAGVGASMGTSLVKGGRWIAAFVVHCVLPRAWSRLEVELLEETAERTWAAIERARAEAALRESMARLEEADRRKTEFLAVLSHELRNPLAPIRNGIYLLEQAAPGSEQAARARAVLRRQSEHLTRLVDDLLDVTRISRGKIELQRARLDLREIMWKTTEDVRSLFEKGAVELRIEHTFEPIWVDADATRLAQVLGNLLQNAAKFTPAGGQVTVAVGAAEGRATLSVRDTGDGIEPTQLERMFEPFAQGGQGLARTRGGLGLGLALVKGLVELHGGSVSASSAGSGRGCEFVVTLPLAPVPGAPTRARGRAGGPSRHVLVVEDNADAARTLADVLSLSGHRVRVAHDARAGLELARERPPDVILCDIGLPDMDGYAFARAARLDPSLARTRLVALTGYAQPEDRAHAREAGFDAHLPKPPPLDVLAALLRDDAGRSSP